MASAGLSRPTTDSPAPRDSSSDDASKILGAQLNRLATRRNARTMQHQLALSVAIGAAVCVPLLVAHRLLLIDLDWWIPAAILSLAVVIGIVRGLSRRIGTFEAALDADRVLGLDERLSSALAFAQPEEWRRSQHRNSQHRKATSIRSSAQSSTRSAKNTRFQWREVLPSRRAVAAPGYVSTASSTTLVPALVQDAAIRVRTLDPKKVYPARFDRTTKVLLVALIAVAGLALMPDLPLLRTPEQRKFAAAMKKQGDELDEIAKPILKQNAIDERSPTKKMAGKLEALARKMQRGRMGKEEALLGIGQLRRDLEKAVAKGDNNSQPERSEVQRLREALQSQQMQSAEGQQMQKELQKGDVQKAADRLDQMADKMDKGQMTPEEKKQAANDLKKAAQALRQNGQEQAAKKLEDAARNMEKQAQQQQGKQGQQQGRQGQNGQQQGQNAGKQGQKQQGGKQGQQQGQSGSQKSGQQGQKQGQQQGKSGGQSQNGQQGQQGQQQQQSGSSGQSGSQSQGQNGQNSTSGGSQALRDMANSMRQGGSGGQSSGNSQNLQNMLNKIKEAEKNAGQNAGQGQGQGEGSGGGENSGQSVTPGKDLMPTDPHGAVGGGAGLGSRSHAQGSLGGGGVSKVKAKRTGDKRRWQDVWTDRLPKTHKKIDRITGKLGDSGEMEQLPTKTEAKGGSARTPYYNVYESYKKDAEDAVAKDAVPPAYKQPVKNYFESLKP